DVACEAGDTVQDQQIAPRAHEEVVPQFHAAVARAGTAIDVVSPELHCVPPRVHDRVVIDHRRVRPVVLDDFDPGDPVPAHDGGKGGVAMHLHCTTAPIHVVPVHHVMMARPVSSHVNLIGTRVGAAVVVHGVVANDDMVQASRFTAYLDAVVVAGAGVVPHFTLLDQVVAT